MSREGQINAEKKLLWGEHQGFSGEGLHFYLTVLNVLCYLLWVLITSFHALCRQIYLELFWAQCGHDSLFTLLLFPWFPYWWGGILINEDNNLMKVALKIKSLFPLYCCIFNNIFIYYTFCWIFWDVSLAILTQILLWWWQLSALCLKTCQVLSLQCLRWGPVRN